MMKLKIDQTIKFRLLKELKKLKRKFNKYKKIFKSTCQKKNCFL